MKSIPSLSGPVSRRDALVILGAIGTVAVASDLAADQRPSVKTSVPAMMAGLTQPFELPKLGYAYDALEPHIDARTMEIHHTKHHKAYIDNANKTLEKLPKLKSLTAEGLLADLTVAPEADRTALRNNVGGHVNHTQFWRLLTPGGPSAPSGSLADAINATFGSLDAFKTAFAAAAASRFGSGWAWLVVTKRGALEITSTANQDSPLMEQSLPVIGLDVWEHAYYLKYQNLRADYTKAFWKVLNWGVAAQYFSKKA